MGQKSLSTCFRPAMRTGDFEKSAFMLPNVYSRHHALIGLKCKSAQESARVVQSLVSSSCRGHSRDRPINSLEIGRFSVLIPVSCRIILVFPNHERGVWFLFSSCPTAGQTFGAGV